jgi:hypothetical protein
MPLGPAGGPRALGGPTLDLTDTGVVGPVFSLAKGGPLPLGYGVLLYDD